MKPNNYDLLYPLSPRDAYRDVSGRTTHGAVAERARVRESKK
jgi:hypothetical protein